MAPKFPFAAWWPMWWMTMPWLAFAPKTRCPNDDCSELNWPEPMTGDTASNHAHVAAYLENAGLDASAAKAAADALICWHAAQAADVTVQQAAYRTVVAALEHHGFTTEAAKAILLAERHLWYTPPRKETRAA
ncbi:MAG: hypothetical protein WAX89_01125 [Alphaproteobacteria bacterium]